MTLHSYPYPASERPIFGLGCCFGAGFEIVGNADRDNLHPVFFGRSCHFSSSVDNGEGNTKTIEMQAGRSYILVARGNAAKMKYSRIYAEFIADRRTKERSIDGYFERHHIVPSNMGGDDAPNNLIRLTAGDHFFAHLLLAKAYGGDQWNAVEAMVNMSGSSKRRDLVVARRWVEKARKEAAKIHSANAKRQHKNGLTEAAHSPSAKAKRKATLADLQWWNDGSVNLRIKSGVSVPDGFVRGALKRRTPNWTDEGKARIHSAVSKPKPYLSDRNRSAAQRAAVSASSSGDNHYSRQPGYVSKLSGDANPTKRLEVAEKISAATKLRDMTNNGRQRAVINLDTGVVYNSATEAAKAYGKSRSHIPAACSGNRPTALGFRWAYVANKKDAA
jgi:hypothetical protein